MQPIAVRSGCNGVVRTAIIRHIKPTAAHIASHQLRGFPTDQLKLKDPMHAEVAGELDRV